MLGDISEDGKKGEEQASPVPKQAAGLRDEHGQASCAQHFTRLEQEPCSNAGNSPFEDCF